MRINQLVTLANKYQDIEGRIDLMDEGYNVDSFDSGTKERIKEHTTLLLKQRDKVVVKLNNLMKEND